MQNRAVGEQVRSARMIAFILGISIILIALVVSMDIFGMYSMFTVRMIQHLLLSLATPPLLLLSIPLLRERTHLDRHTLFLGGHVPVFHAGLYAFFHV